ncbi:MAG: hypothetical protein A2Y24_06775 [Clostridiales bacterium GWE2_32_10]|nr:MAG: hypothetical protein A2Y24_06775 [Clostridiales bacterium GWE2_32_10]
MSDSKRYYYLKLKENFYDTEEIKILESCKNGYLYSNILLKMYLKSLKNEGRLTLNMHIPYNPQMIATIVGHNIDVVEKALKIFKDLKLIEILDNGTIYMLDMQNYIGKSTTEGDRKRLYRSRIKEEKELLELTEGTIDGQKSDIYPLEIELDLEKERELEIDKENTYTCNLEQTKKEIESDKIDCDKIKDLFNQICSNLPKVRSLSANRRKAIKNRIKTLTNLSIDYNAYFSIVSNISFLNGENKNNWSADFDWLLKESNMLKVVEGKYISNSESKRYKGIKDWLNEMKEGADGGIN